MLSLHRARGGKGVCNGLAIRCACGSRGLGLFASLPSPAHYDFVSYRFNSRVVESEDPGPATHEATVSQRSGWPHSCRMTVRGPGVRNCVEVPRAVSVFESEGSVWRSRRGDGGVDVDKR